MNSVKIGTLQNWVVKEWFYIVSIVCHDDKLRDDIISEANSEIRQLKPFLDPFPEKHKESLYSLCFHQDIKDASDGCTEGMINAICLINFRKSIDDVLNSLKSHMKK